MHKMDVYFKLFCADKWEMTVIFHEQTISDNDIMIIQLNLAYQKIIVLYE